MLEHRHARRTSSSRRSWPSSSSWSGREAASSALRRSRDSARTNRRERWCAKVAKETSVEVKIEDRTLKLTYLDKVLYLEAGITKEQSIDYYKRIPPEI